MKPDGPPVIVPIPEYFEPDASRPGWMRGSNGVWLKGEKWQTLGLCQAYRRRIEWLENALADIRARLG